MKFAAAFRRRTLRNASGGKKKAAGPSAFSSSGSRLVASGSLSCEGSSATVRKERKTTAEGPCQGRFDAGDEDPKARPNDFNGRRMTLQAIQLLAERASIRLAGATRGRGNEKRRPVAGLKALGPLLLAARSTASRRGARARPREWPDKEETGGKKRAFFR